MVIDRHPKIGITHTQYNSWKASRTGQEEPKWTIWMRSWHARKSHYSQHSHLITLTVMTRPDHRCKHHCNGNWLSTLSATSHHPKTLCVNYLLRILYSRYLLISFHKLYKPRWFIEDRLLCMCVCVMVKWEQIVVRYVKNDRPPLVLLPNCKWPKIRSHAIHKAVTTLLNGISF